MRSRRLTARRTLLLCGAYLLLILPLSGCASIPSTRYIASIGQGADSLSTVMALNAGLVEGNPIVAGSPWLLAVKPIIPLAFDSEWLPKLACRPIHRAWAHAGFGPAVHNVALLLGAPSAVAWGALAVSVPLLWDWIAHGAERACR
jgi:hypothetical protein